ncbi:prostate and testis expressed protein 4-like [Sphaerodactylus townsendi]|uniref:prostate and testis expressed protein 4-like n=1 Tax=Sphaerodactylus townsendi TaxID=933632 RepID=UPI0020273074|nr:prostate and testis expressed protein 4-like [Sphaerodactylus townsendi]
MKRILVLAFAVLLCLATVTSLRCKTCTKYEEDSCVNGEGICVANKSMRCGDLFTPENDIILSFCAQKFGCEMYNKENVANTSSYVVCCNRDLCNGQPLWALTNETSPESDATSFPEKL